MAINDDDGINDERKNNFMMLNRRLVDKLISLGSLQKITRAWWNNIADYTHRYIRA